MRVYCNNLDGILNADKNKYSYADIIVFGFNSIGKITYKNELSWQEDNLIKLSKLAKNLKKTVILGAYTDNYGVIRKSVLVNDNGKILGIADMHVKRQDTAISIGYGYTIYQSQNGKIGVLIDDDLFSVEAVKSMSTCDVDLIVVISDKIDKSQYNYLVRSYSLLFGVPILFLTPNAITVTDCKGEILLNCTETEADIIIPTKKVYTYITTKQRGLHKL